MILSRNIVLAAIASCTLISCNFMLGSKEDDTTNDIFKQGKIDPNLVPQNVGYVPVQPFFSGFSNPVDVYVGYDEMIYVIDDNGVNILDQAGRKYRTIPIPGATDIAQDRRLHTYVLGRTTVNHGGIDYDVAAIYHLINTATADGPFFVDTLVHPACDESRKNVNFRGNDDVKVKFTGITVLHDNTLYVSRTGPNNSTAAIAYPDNTILSFNSSGKNIGYSNGLSPNVASIRSAYNVQAIAGFAGPPQRLFGMSESRDFFITQYDSLNPVEFGVIGIRYEFNPDFGSIYDGRPELLNFDTSKAARFMYEPYRFGKPADVYIAPDAQQYIFVVDSQKDSLFQFTNSGFEGVNPPANYFTRKQLLASFGGRGSGLFNFREPSAVCYFKKMVYVADKGNGRICRYKLSTDIE